MEILLTIVALSTAAIIMAKCADAVIQGGRRRKEARYRAACTEYPDMKMSEIDVRTLTDRQKANMDIL